MRQLIITIILATLPGLPEVPAQEVDVIFFEPQALDTITKPARPADGYPALLKMLERRLSKGDTIGKKYRIDLWSLGIKISRSGVVDSAYVRINHAACPIHRKIADELKSTVWEAARDKGIAVSWEGEIYEALYVNRRVLRKYKCTRSFGEWLLAPWIN